MSRRVLSETGYYHVTSRSAGQIALFENDEDRRHYLLLLKEARDKAAVRVLAWVLMTDHVHLVIDTKDKPGSVSEFMQTINSRYTRYFNAKTGRTGTLFQGRYWSKPITSDSQLVATVYYVHMNPEVAGIASMRSYHWSSYQEYLGRHWVVDTGTILGLFGSFEAFDAYEGSPRDVVAKGSGNRDEAILEMAMRVAGVSSSDELRSLTVKRRSDTIRQLARKGASTREISRVFGIGASTVSRITRGA